MARVINRKPQQQIFISHPDGRIVVTVVSVSGPVVRLGITAPASAIIERGDLVGVPETKTTT